MIENLVCPVSGDTGDRVRLAHGEGARLTRELIHELILPAFDNALLRPLGDAALLPAVDGRLVMTTDSFVVSPLVFPGGDIGSLAVHGTINDLAVSGAEPLYLSVALMIEEGLLWSTLRRIIGSLSAAAHDCRVTVVTGDTKVVPRGAVDGLFITTTGIGRLRPGVDLGPHRVCPGDCVIVSGTVGDHGIAVLSARDEFNFGDTLRSDSAPLHDLMAALFQTAIDVHFARDPTRGGVSAVLHELVQATGLTAVVDERRIPVSEPVRGACELLGLDPLYVANEGKVLLIVSPHDAARILQCLAAHDLGRQACVIGEMQKSDAAQVLVRGALGTLRVLDEPSGSPLPRIC